jgi:microcompartment protein CcmL/EutN
LAEKPSGAAGLLVVYGLVTAFAAVDAACKAANVSVEAFDKNKPANSDKLPIPLLVMVKLRGKLHDIQAAMTAGRAAAESLGGVLSAHIIPQPDAETEKILAVNEIKKP